MRRVVLVALAFVACGCANTLVRHVTLPDGTLAAEAVCWGGKTAGDCMNLAAASCDGKYKLLNNAQTSNPVHVGLGIVATANRVSLIYRCENGKPPKVDLKPEGQKPPG